MGLIIDTSVFVRIERSGELPNFRPWRAWEPFYISAITVSEMQVGLLRSEGEKRRTIREQFINMVRANAEVLSFDEPTALEHAEMMVELWRKGKPIGSHDALIAASALRHGCAVLTCNVREFEQVQGLEVLPFDVPPDEGASDAKRPRS